MTNKQIAELINRRRHQMLVHSYLYYHLDSPVIDDMTWTKWAMELQHLQEQYPDIAKEVKYSDDFADWDGSTGAFLDYMKPNIMKTADRLLHGFPKVNKPTPSKPKLHKLF